MSENREKIRIIQTAYIPLLSKFLDGRLSAWDFSQRYFDVMLEDPTVSSKPDTFKVLQAIFEDCDAYWPTPDPAKWPAEIGEEELRECCQKNLEKLKQIVETDG